MRPLQGPGGGGFEKSHVLDCDPRFAGLGDQAPADNPIVNDDAYHQAQWRLGAAKAGGSFAADPSDPMASRSASTSVFAARRNHLRAIIANRRTWELSCSVLLCCVISVHRPSHALNRSAGVPAIRSPP